ncbi:MAG: fluoride efflux transporter CrcB [Anaerolineae bacterium]|nr:fluoride efflux transporter CrcB [Anaerolineae bacterium]
METIIFVGIGGFLGANARYLLSSWMTYQLAENYEITFPYGTLAVNFIGSALLAFFIGWVSRHVELPVNIRLLVATGFFGAFTTFSTFANETVALAQQGNWLGAAGNLIGTNLICILGVLLGLAVVSRL